MVGDKTDHDRRPAGGFGQTVRGYRLRLGMSQEDLARAAGVDVKTIRNIEAGRCRPRLSTLSMLADALRLHGDECAHLRAQVSAGAGALPAQRSPAAVPAQLPADVAGFTGRAMELDLLDSLLAEAGATGAGESTAVVVATISGTAGVGKSALAVHWAHRVARLFPDGQLYVNLRGFDPEGQVMAPAEAIRGFLDTLAAPPGGIPPQPDAQAALYRSLLAGKRMLVLLDNALDSGQVRPLLPGTASCLVLVTSRNQLTGLVATGARPLILDTLSPDESRELLAHRLGTARVTAEPQAVESIITACSRLPLALAIAAARAQQTGFALSALAGELDHAAGRLDVLDTGEASTQIRAAFSWSYQALTPPAARVFRLLGLHAGPDISAAAATSLSGDPLPEARRSLAELTRANLLVEHTPGRFTLHDLLRVYAANLADTELSEVGRRAATGRLLDYYTHTAHAAARQIDPSLDPIPLPLAAPAAGVCPECFTHRPQATAWLVTERLVLLPTLHHAADDGWYTHAWQLAWALRRFLDWQGHLHNLTSVAQVALTAGQHLGDPAAEAFAHRLTARPAVVLRRFDEAYPHLLAALDLYGQAADATGQADGNNDLAVLYGRQGQFEKGLAHARQFLALSQEAGHLQRQALALNAIGWFHSHLGDHTQALGHCRQALALLEQSQDREGQANTWDTMGIAHSHLGHHAEAIDCFRHALPLFADRDDRSGQAGALTNLGDAYRRAGDPAAARQAWRQALATLASPDRTEAREIRARLRDLDVQPGTPDPPAPLQRS